MATKNPEFWKLIKVPRVRYFGPNPPGPLGPDNFVELLRPDPPAELGTGPVAGESDALARRQFFRRCSCRFLADLLSSLSDAGCFTPSGDGQRRRERVELCPTRPANRPRPPAMAAPRIVFAVRR